MFSKPIGPDYFNAVLLKYDPTTGFSEEKKTKTNIRFIDFFIKIFRYIFNANARLQHVVSGLVAEAGKRETTISQIPLEEAANFIVYARLFRNTVVDKHNKPSFTTVVNPEPLEIKIKELTTAFFKRTFSEIENGKLTPELQAASKRVLDLQEISIGPENFSEMARLAHLLGHENLREQCERYGFAIVCGLSRWRFTASKPEGEDPSGLTKAQKLSKLEELFDLALRYNLSGTQKNAVETIKPNLTKDDVEAFILRKNVEEMFKLSPELKARCDELLCEKFTQRINEAAKGFVDAQKIPKDISKPDVLLLNKTKAVLLPLCRALAFGEGPQASNPPSMQSLFDQAVKLGYKKFAKSIYQLNLKNCAGVEYPLSENLFLSKQDWINYQNLETMRQAYAAPDGPLSKWKKFMQKNLSTMLSLFPDDESYKLLKSALETANLNPQQRQLLMQRVLLPYIAETTLHQPEGEFDSLTADQQIDHYKVIKDFAVHSRDPKLLNFVDDLIQIEKVLFKADAEMRRLSAPQQLELYEKIVFELYPLKSPRDIKIKIAREKYTADFEWYSAYKGLYTTMNQYGKSIREAYPDQTADVTLKIGQDQKVRCHKTLLSKYSGHFQGLFQHGNPAGVQFAESVQSEIDLALEDGEGAAMADLIRYIYTKEIAIIPANAGTILRLADFYLVQPMIPIFIAWFDWVTNYIKDTDVSKWDLVLIEQILTQAEERELNHFCGQIVEKLLNAVIANPRDPNSSPAQMQTYQRLLKTYGKHLKHFSNYLTRDYLGVICTEYPNLETVTFTCEEQGNRPGTKTPRPMLGEKEFASLGQLKNLKSLEIQSLLPIDVNALKHLQKCPLQYFKIQHCFLESAEGEIPDVQCHETLTRLFPNAGIQIETTKNASKTMWKVTIRFKKS